MNATSAPRPMVTLPLDDDAAMSTIVGRVRILLHMLPTQVCAHGVKHSR